MQKYKKSFLQFFKFSALFLKPLSLSVVLAILFGCAAKTENAATQSDQTYRQAVNEKTIDQFIESIKDKQKRAWLIEFKNSFSETDRFSISESDDSYKIIVTHESTDKHTGGTEAYRIDKKTGQSHMIWHEHPIQLQEDENNSKVKILTP